MLSGSFSKDVFPLFHCSRGCIIINNSTFAPLFAEWQYRLLNLRNTPVKINL